MAQDDMGRRANVFTRRLTAVYGQALRSWRNGLRVCEVAAQLGRFVATRSGVLSRLADRLRRDPAFQKILAPEATTVQTEKPDRMSWSPQ